MAAIDTGVVVNLHEPLVVLVYSPDRTGSLTRNRHMDHRMEGTHVETFSTFDASFLHDPSPSVGEYNGVLRTIGQTRTGKASPTGIGDPVLLIGATATSGSNGGQGGQGLRFGSQRFTHVSGKRLVLVIVTVYVDAEQCHDPVPDHGTLLVHTTPVGITFTWNNVYGQRVDYGLQCIGEVGLEDFGVDPALHQGILVVDLKHRQPP